jgi:hypothetical protein
MFVSICLIVSLMALAVLGQTPVPATGTTGTSGTSGTTATTSTAQPAATKFTATPTPKALEPTTDYPDAVTVKATDAAGTGVAGVVFDVLVAEGDVRVYSGSKIETPLNGLKTSGTDGLKTFSFITGQKDFRLRIVPHGADNTADVTKIVDLSFSLGPKFKDALSSNRSFLELFMGQTFANNYDASGKNTGFGNAGQLVQLTFDTMWKRPPTRWIPPCPRQPADVTNSPMSSATTPVDQPPPTHSECHPADATVHDGLLHTELNMAFTKFPFGSATTTSGAAPLENAFTGTLGLIWQPDSWASYSNTSREAGLPYDAVRWGIFSRAGFTTRAQKNDSGDAAIGRGQLGFRFTHHHSRASTGSEEVVNYIPIRFVEVSYGWFEQFQGAKTHQAHRRLVIDGGIRLVPLSNKVIPFYAGVHANVGKGPDDVRVFAGFLFKLDKIAELMGSSIETP